MQKQGLSHHVVARHVKARRAGASHHYPFKRQPRHRMKMLRQTPTLCMRANCNAPLLQRTPRQCFPRLRLLRQPPAASVRPRSHPAHLVPHQGQPFHLIRTSMRASACCKAPHLRRILLQGFPRLQQLLPQLPVVNVRPQSLLVSRPGPSWNPTRTPRQVLAHCKAPHLRRMLLQDFHHLQQLLPQLPVASAGPQSLEHLAPRRGQVRSRKWCQWREMSGRKPLGLPIDHRPQLSRVSGLPASQWGSPSQVAARHASIPRQPRSSVQSSHRLPPRLAGGDPQDLARHRQG